MEIVLFIVGALFFTVGALILWDFNKFKQAAKKSTGQIVAYSVKQSRSRNSGTSEVYAPVVQYQVNGEQHQFTASVASSQVKYQIGDKIPILIHRKDSSQARLDSPISKILGAVFVTIGLAMMVAFFFVFKFDAISVGIAIFIITVLSFKALSALRRHNIHSIDDLKKNIEKIKKSGIIPNKQQNHEHIITDADKFTRHVNKRNTAPVWLLSIFLLVGIALSSGGVYLGVQRVDFLQSAITGNGTVVGFNSKTSTSDGKTTTTYYPQVKYLPNSSSQTITFEHDVGSSHPSYRTGDSVVVLYSPEDPNEAIIDEGWMNYFGPILMLGIGVIFALVGGSLIIKQRKQKASQQNLKLDF